MSSAAGTMFSRRQSSRAACAFTLTLVFFSGAVAGAIAYNFGSRKLASKSVPFWTVAGKDRTLERWKKELDLTPDQTKEVELILDDFTMYYRSVLSDGKAKIVRILNDDQRKRFERLLVDAQK